MAYLGGNKVHTNEMRYKMYSRAAGEMRENSHVQMKGMRSSGLLSTPKFLYQKRLKGVWGTAVPQIH